MVQCPPTGGDAVKRLIREPEKPSFPARCRVLAEAAVLWGLLAAGAQLLLPAEKTALPEGAALGWAALRICLVTPLAEELAFRGGALYLLPPLGGAGAVVVCSRGRRGLPAGACWSAALVPPVHPGTAGRSRL